MAPNDSSARPSRAARIIGPDQGRKYVLHQSTATFIADGAETNDRYSISEWAYEPGTGGPAAHAHDDLYHVFYIIEGTLSVFVGGQWLDAAQGSYVVIPGGTRHDFSNRGKSVTRFVNFDMPGRFESALRRYATSVGDPARD